ncbi:MAG: bile acid:sodium symporter [Gammaproteobacteria bacterium]|nr:bile acid:sodium symporter [Gammaproteobacteria bacterium]MCY4338997.1 bile acid:sodium symporter [Gammaproteobacteria bacterium]
MTFYFLTQYVFPTIIFTIMFGMGLALRTGDFQPVFTQPRAAILGLVGQLALLPLWGLLLTHLLPVAAEIAVGLMLLAASPGGVTSNAIAFTARADIALSICLTAVSSILVSFTLPLWATYAINTFMGAAAELDLPLGKSILQLALLTILPLTMGMITRRYAGEFAVKAVEFFRKFSIILICFLALSTVWFNLDYFSSMKDFLTIMGLCALFMLTIMCIAYITSIYFRLSTAQGMTIVIETGVQNLAITLFAVMTLLQRPEVGRLPLVYGILMITVPWVFVAYFKRQQTAAAGVKRDATQEGNS